MLTLTALITALSPEGGERGAALYRSFAANRKATITEADLLRWPQQFSAGDR